MSRFIISCGGTGGHLAPGLAIGQALIDGGHDVDFAISTKAVDSRLVEKYSKLKFHKSPGAPFAASPAGVAKFLSEFVKAVRFGLRLIDKTKCDAVISFGGFTSLGLSVAAILRGKKIILHEANRKPGKAVRLLGPFASRIFLPYGIKIPRGKSDTIKNAGYPVRAEIVKTDPSAAKAAFGFGPDANILLILGGSQGAAALNEWCDANFPTLAKHDIDVLCVCGQGKHKFPSRSAVSASGQTRFIKFLEFCDNMAGALSAATAVIARAGAGTIAELARCQVPSIIVPYPYAADNHQTENAKCFEKQGACVMVEQKNLDTLLSETLELMSNGALRDGMKKNLERVDSLNDTSKIVSEIESALKEDR